MSQLLDQVRDQIRTLRYSIRTEEAYLKWIHEFILFHAKRHPNEWGPHSNKRCSRSARLMRGHGLLIAVIPYTDYKTALVALTRAVGMTADC